MSNVKKNLLQEIADKVKRKVELRAKMAQRNLLDSFVLNFINNVEEISEFTHDDAEWINMVKLATQSLDSSIKSLDNNSTMTVSWQEIENMHPQVNGVLVSWSAEYQAKNNCEPELFVDITSLLLK